MFLQKYFGRINLLLFVLLVSYIAEAQDFHFRGYTTSTEPAISSRFVNTINQDDKGFLWIGTGSGLNRFDGKVFRTNFLPDSLGEINLKSSLKASNGDLWFGTNDGLLLRFDGVDFSILSMREYSSNAITGMVETIENEILIATQNRGILKINPKNTRDVSQFPIEPDLIHCINIIADRKLLVGTNDGLFLYTLPIGNQPMQLIRKLDEVPSTTIQTIKFGPISGHFYIGTADKGLFILKPGSTADTYEVVKLNGGVELDQLSVKSVVEDNEKNVWLSTQRNGVIKVFYPFEGDENIKYQIYERENGLLSDNTNAIFQDDEGNIWIGTYGGGLSMLVDEAFTFFSFNQPAPGASINSIAADENNYYALGDKGIQVIEKISGQKKEIYTAANGLPNDNLNSIYFSEETKDLWIGTNENGLYRLSLLNGKVRPYFVSDDMNENSISSIAGEGNRIWTSTKNGIFMFDIESNSRKHYTVSNGALPHNDIKQVFLDDEGKLWFCTLSDDLYYLTESVGKEAKLIDMGTGFEFQAIAKGANGDIWAATYGNGIMHITSDSIYFVTTETGLLSKYCYSILLDSEENVWVGHRQGFSRIRMEGDNHLVRTYGESEGIPGEANTNAVYLDNEGRVILGTTKGMVVYDHRMDKKNLSAPKVNITAITFIDEIDEGEIIPYSEKIIMPYSNYKLRVDFVGISFKDPAGVSFSYKLDNYDNEWSDLSKQSFAEFPKLDDGEYKFWLNAYNADFKSNNEPFSFSIIIKKPFWKTWWFISLIILFFVAIVVVIIKVRERNLRIQEAYLKEELDIRTKEVVLQKEEIELKNRDITDSINYAQRIQASILPPLQKLKDNFSGTFVFYRPRDIVSGDFYWWDRIDDERFIVVCADSTGHGVPGAFMSMIGSTLIKDIVNRNPRISPSELLTILNQEVVESLNQRVDLENVSDEEERYATTDGMDIVVCEFNTKTYFLRFASAMRPIIMYHKGEQYYIRGHRSSVGGSLLKGKEFENQEYQLAKGDIVYLFSDGYPDQFGGPQGKKFKMVALKDKLEEIHTKDVDEQYREIEETFDSWKGDQDQVDDVLFMGIQV